MDDLHSTELVLSDDELAKIRLQTMLEEVNESESVAELTILIGLMDADEQDLFQSAIDAKSAELKAQEAAIREAAMSMTKKDLLAALDKLRGEMQKLEAENKATKQKRAAIKRTNDHVWYSLTELGAEWDPVTPQKVALLTIFKGLGPVGTEINEPALFEMLESSSVLKTNQSAIRIFKYYRKELEEAGAIFVRRG